MYRSLFLAKQKMIDVLEKTEIKLLRLSKQVTNNEYIITIIKDNQVMQVSVCVSQVTVQQTCGGYCIDMGVIALFFASF